MPYVNVKTVYGVETIDSIFRHEFKTRKDYLKDKRQRLADHRSTGMNAYYSQRATKEWRESDNDKRV